MTDYLGNPFEYPEESLIGPFLEAGKGWDAVLAKALPILVHESEPVLCEVGSNIGASLMQMLAAKPASKVFAFGPSDRFRPYLERNVQLAGFSEQVKVSGRMLGSRPGLKFLHNNASSASAVSKSYDNHPPKGSQLVWVSTLDRALKGAQVDFLKVDTDGYEFEVLKGAKRTLERFKPVLHVEIAPYLIDDPVGGLRWLKRFGYHQFLCLGPEGAFVGITAAPEQVVGWTEVHGYCDIVTAVAGSPAERSLSQLAVATEKTDSMP